MVNPQNTGRHTSNAKTLKTSQRTRRKPHQVNHRPVNDSTMNHAALFFWVVSRPQKRHLRDNHSFYLTAIQLIHQVTIVEDQPGSAGGCEKTLTLVYTLALNNKDRIYSCTCIQNLYTCRITLSCQGESGIGKHFFLQSFPPLL